MAQEDSRYDVAAWLVMMVSLALALISWRVALEQDRRQAVLRFEFAVDTTTEAIASRMQAYELALRATRGLFDGSQRVERVEWTRFVAALRLVETLPGVQGVGFARWLDAAQLDAFVAAMRDGGLPGFTVRPSESADRRAVIELLEPLGVRNRQALGYDLYAEPARRDAMDAARDSGQPAITRPVRLRHDEDTHDDPVGFLMVLPLYRSAAIPPSIPARRDALLGFVYSPFLAGDLMRGVLPREVKGLGFEVHDGESAGSGTLLHVTAAGGQPVHDASRTLQLPGRAWTLRFSGTSEFDDTARSHQPTLVAAVGGLMNVALLLFLRSESRERRRAIGEARRLAAEVAGRRTAEHAMRASERRFREVFEASPTGLLMVDARGRIALANPEVEHLFGYGRGELLGRPIDDLVPDALRDAHAAHRDPYPIDPGRPHVAARPGRDLHGRRRDGSRIPLELSLNPIGREGETTVLAGVVDLSARQAGQDLLAAALREKTVLLDEVHHRVKNNLQVITSLLSLQARGAPPEARTALAECRNRVHAMALTHQLLHEHGDVARLHVGEYLRRLGALLGDSHRSAAPSVTLRVDGADTPLHLGLPRAIPCGLLVNELVGNAYKHAFPDGRTGTITIALTLDGGTARLTVRDDGIGLPAGFELGDARSLGFQLVPLLVDQLGATIAHVPGAGTCFAIEFPADPKGAT